MSRSGAADATADGTEVHAAPSAELDRIAAEARRRSARFSVAAAAFLVALKLGTGLITGSIAFLAEAAHSATDLVAALLTLFAVRVATRPPDEQHHYGHGKAEHLGALAESAILLLLALAIARSSVRRLASGHAEGVEATWPAATCAPSSSGPPPPSPEHADPSLVNDGSAFLV